MLGPSRSRLPNTLARARRKFESRMRATAVVTRATGNMTTDADGYEVPEFVQVYPNPDWPADHPHKDGKCYFRYPGLAFESNFDSVGITVAQSRLVGRFPFGVTFAVDDVVEVLSDLDNPRFVGMVFRMASIDDQSQATAQRMLLEDNQKGVKFDV